jgi:hypothetical protein
VQRLKQPVLIFEDEDIKQRIHSLPEEEQFDWSEIFVLFKKHEVKDVPIEYLKMKDFNAEKIKEILVKKHDFSEDRIEKQLDKLRHLKEARKQTGLGNWF